MSMHITVIKADKDLLNLADFEKYCETHWNELKVNETYQDCLDDICVIFRQMVDNDCAPDYAGGIRGGIIRFLNSYIHMADKNSKEMLDDRFYDHDEVLILCDTSNQP